MYIYIYIYRRRRTPRHHRHAPPTMSNAGAAAATAPAAATTGEPELGFTRALVGEPRVRVNLPLGQEYTTPARPIHRRFRYEEHTSTHAQGTDPRVALGA